MLLSCLSKVTDPRRGQGRRYELPYLLLFAVLAVLCGATSYRKIQRFIHAHRERFNEWFELDWKRAPAHTSIRLILQALAVNDVEQAFRAHSQQLSNQEDNEEKLYIAFDGKVLRGSFDHFQDQKAAQLLGAFCPGDQLILGHLPIAKKSNEIPAVQQLIDELGLSGCVYTLDALHCQAETFDAAKAEGSELLVQVKGNQPTLFDALQHASLVSTPLSHHLQFNHQHNRMEWRDVTVFEALPILSLLPDPAKWSERIATVIEVQRRTDTVDTRTKTWKISTETSYYVASYEDDAQTFGYAIRDHWGIENRNHYVRDVTLKEDASRIRRNPGIFARLRSFALNILRKNKVTNVSQALYDNALNLNNVCQYVGVF